MPPPLSLFRLAKSPVQIGLNDNSIIDAKEFHKLQAVYFQVMADVRNVDNESPDRRKLSKNYSGRNKESKKRHGTKIVGFSFCMLFNCFIIRIMKSKFKQIYYSTDGYRRGKLQY